jgi:hypothetical protein
MHFLRTLWFTYLDCVLQNKVKQKKNRYKPMPKDKPAYYLHENFVPPPKRVKKVDNSEFIQTQDPDNPFAEIPVSQAEEDDPVEAYSEFDLDLLSQSIKASEKEKLKTFMKNPDEAVSESSSEEKSDEDLSDEELYVPFFNPPEIYEEKFEENPDFPDEQPQNEQTTEENLESVPDDEAENPDNDNDDVLIEDVPVDEAENQSSPMDTHNKDSFEKPNDLHNVDPLDYDRFYSRTEKENTNYWANAKRTPRFITLMLKSMSIEAYGAPMMEYTLSFLLASAWLAGEPLLSVDLTRWVIKGKVPYFEFGETYSQFDVATVCFRVSVGEEILLFVFYAFSNACLEQSNSSSNPDGRNVFATFDKLVFLSS